MKTTNQNSMASEVGLGLVKTIIAVVGLLIIRLVIGNLPMLKDAQADFSRRQRPGSSGCTVF